MDARHPRGAGPQVKRQPPDGRDVTAGAAAKGVGQGLQSPRFILMLSDIDRAGRLRMVDPNRLSSS